MFQRALSILETEESESSAGIAYDRACYYALTGALDDAIASLQTALARGYADEWLATDPDLESLHGRADFEAIVVEAKHRVAAKKE